MGQRSGTVVEWYYFLIYGTAAALVFNKLFCPRFAPAAGTLAAFGTYAIGFAARPLGGIVFGHFGDRLGRETMLMLTMIIMGTGTFLIGCLPTFGQIGIWAPLLLIAPRFIQSFGLGGEWGGAVLKVVEHAPAGRRGLYGGFAPIIATALLAWAGATWPVSLYPMVLGVIAAVAVLAAKETHTDGIDRALSLPLHPTVIKR